MVLQLNGREGENEEWQTAPNNSFNRSRWSLIFIRKTWMLGSMFPARLIRALGVFLMHNQDKKALGCMWLLGSVILSILIPGILVDMGVKSDLVWNILAPGWKLFPFGHADLPEMFLALSLDAIIYAALTYSIIYLVVWMASREKYP